MNYQMILATARYFFITFLLAISVVLSQTPDQLLNMTNPPKKLVQDYAKIFDARQLNYLENKLDAYNDSTSTQILVLTIKSLEGYPLETFANEIGQNWGVGTSGKDNGVVIVLSLEDRKITIRTGYGAQIHIPPSVNKSIIDNVIVPYFREGRYAEGINKGVESIIKAFAGKYKNNKKSNDTDIGTIIIFILFFMFILYIMIRKGGRNNGNNNGGGRNILNDIIIMNSGSSIFGRGSSSGNSGGFGGFGGGGFGGGGASGSW